MTNKISIIAEVGSNWRLEDWEKSHDLALAAVSEVADTGATDVKFQILRAETLYSGVRAPEHRNNVRPYQLPLEWLPELQAAAKTRHIGLWASIWDVNLVFPVAKHLTGIKIGSGDMTYRPMVDECVNAANSYGIELAISTGAATQQEIEKMLDRVVGIYTGPKFTLMHCVSAYPAKPSSYNLLGGTIFRDTVDSIGLSDHTTGGSLTAQLAIALGYSMFEKHFTPANASTTTPDYSVSLNKDAFKKYVLSVAYAYSIVGKLEKKVDASEEDERLWARRGKDGLRPVDKTKEVK
jgi:N,N'-diacetyllegionaminate synthase